MICGGGGERDGGYGRAWLGRGFGSLCWLLSGMKSTSNARARTHLAFPSHALRSMHIARPNKHKQDLTKELASMEASVDEFKFDLDEPHQFIDDMMHKEDPERERERERERAYIYLSIERERERA